MVAIISLWNLMQFPIYGSVFWVQICLSALVLYSSYNYTGTICFIQILSYKKAAGAVQQLICVGELQSCSGPDSHKSAQTLLLLLKKTCV